MKSYLLAIFGLMIRISICTLSIFFIGLSSQAQCVLDYYSLEKKVYISDLVIEGKVISQQSYWDAQKRNIYTLNRIKVFKALNGIAVNQEIELITDGGSVGFTRHQASPSLHIEIGEEGVFLLKVNTIKFDEVIMKNGYDKFRLSASLQSFIQYNRLDNVAYGYHEKYLGIGSLLLPKIEGYSGFAPIKIQNPDKGQIIRPTAAPAITSFGLDTITAGTQSVLVINGTNFGIAKGKGSVDFRDANYGDGRYYKTTLKTNYKSWSNTKIEVYVPSRAGTGRVRVTNNGNESGTSASNIYIPFSHINVKYGTSTLDTAFHQIDHVNDNAKGGYTWQMTSQFARKKSAVNAFFRSLENWRCGTLMNWDVGQNTSKDVIASDGINIVRYTKFGDSRLGVCWSRWNGCGSANNLVWFLMELDIEFDSTRNWYYGDGTTPNSQFDFESVATHELGHGHQLGHVVDTKKIMHYSIGKGDRKTTLQAEDIAAGVYVRDKSKVKNSCGPNPIVPIKADDCNITKPKAKFISSRSSACPETHFIFTDATEGIVTSYAWTFDQGGSISSGNTKGPFAVKYSSGGNKTIQLIVGNDFGKDTFEMTVRVDSASPEAVDTIPLAAITCVGSVQYVINRPARAETYDWSVSAGGTISSGQTNDTVNVSWTTAGGPYTLSVKAKNTCGESGSKNATTSVKAVAKASFSSSETGLEVTFTNASTSAISYKWHFGDGDSSTDASPFHIYPTKGDYNALLQASNECSIDSFSKLMSVTYGAGVSEIHGKKRVVISPNPLKNSAELIYHHIGYPKATFLLYDLQGRLVRNMEVRNGESTTIKRHELISGTYFYELRSGQIQIETGRLILE
jgi:PKD repeat protein